MTETGEALREVSDALIRDLESLSSLEDQKRQLVPGDDRLVALSQQIEEIASRVLDTSERQRELSQQAHELADVGHPAAPARPIDETPRAISTILAEWRAAERRGDADEVAALREEYRRAHQAARGT